MLYANPMKFRQLRVNTLLDIKQEDVTEAAKRLSDSCEKSCRKAVFCNKSDNFAGNIIRLPL